MKTIDAVDAMCAWEHVLDTLHEDIKLDKHGKWSLLFESIGACASREHVACLVPALTQGWKIANKAGFDAPFDWEFVPAFLDRATDNDCNLLSAWEQIAVQIAEESK